MSTVPFTMRVDPALKAAIEEEAQRQDISASQIATRAIRSHLNGQAAERAAIEAAVIEADKGKFVSEEVFTAWVQSWDTENELPMPKAE
jgi:predicted transcriptional regulator